MLTRILTAFIVLLVTAGTSHSITGHFITALSKKEPDPSQLCIIAGTAKFVITAETGDIDMLVQTCDGSIVRFRVNIHDYVNPRKPPVADQEV